MSSNATPCHADAVSILAWHGMTLDKRVGLRTNPIFLKENSDIPVVSSCITYIKEL